LDLKRPSSLGGSADSALPSSGARAMSVMAFRSSDPLCCGGTLAFMSLRVRGPWRSAVFVVALAIVLLVGAWGWAFTRPDTAREAHDRCVAALPSLKPGWVYTEDPCLNVTVYPPLGDAEGGP
jgi:hypothetical protein